MRNILFILGLLLALNLNAQVNRFSDVKAPTIQNIFTRDVSTARQLTKAVTTAEDFVEKEQTRLSKSNQALWRPTLSGQLLFHNGSQIYMVPTKSTKDSVTTWYDRPCIVVQKTSKAGKPYYAWKSVPAGDWATLTGKTSSK